MTTIPRSLQTIIDEVQTAFPNNKKLNDLFARCFVNTYSTTLQPMEDGTTFVITGDIPAMWLRDSAAQVRPYLLAANEDEKIKDMLTGVVNRQIKFILHDPYANAFNAGPSGDRYHEDQTEMTAWMWERKYEIDSLCYPLQLAYLLWKTTGDTAHLGAEFHEAVRTIVEVFKTEQHHEEKSAYRFERETQLHTETLIRDGLGSEVGHTGMTWCGFRPSDDACTYGYLVPANMFAVVALGYAAEMCETVLEEEALAKECRDLAAEIRTGIEKHGVIDHPHFGKIYAYEVDGRGNYLLMDDANVPSLLAAPYLGYCDYEDEVYQNTRKFILSRNNPFYYEGSVAKGIGSPHTPDHYVWHIALAIQGMTSIHQEERDELLETFLRTDGETGFMHEGFNASKPEEFTREWFAWSNTMFSEFILSYIGKTVTGSPLHERQKNA